MKPGIIILCTLLTSTALASSGGNIGAIDNRRYGSLTDPVYSAVGRFMRKSTGGTSVCTAGFISSNLIITNRHCVTECDPITTCHIRFWNGTKYIETETINLEAIGKPGNTMDGQDWAILRTRDPNPNFKNVASKSTTGPIKRGGFGDLRVIKDSEVQPLKALFNQTYARYYNNECRFQEDPLSCVWGYFNTAVKNAGYEPLLGDSDKFKVQSCNITGTHPKYPNMLSTDCDSSGGDSGAPLLRGDLLVGLNNSGPHIFATNDDSVGGSAVKNENFYPKARSLINANAQSPAPGLNGANTHPAPATHTSGNNTQPPKPTTGNGTHTPTQQPNPPAPTPNPTPNNPVTNTPEPPAQKPTPPVQEPPVSAPPIDNPVGTAITDPAEIRRILNEEIMQLECD